MSSPTSLLPGDRFGRYQVLRYDHTKSYKESRHHYYLCKCDCGNEKVVSGTHLRRGKIASCGCLQVEMRIFKPIHGHTGKGHSKGTRTYQIWGGMLKRCNNPKSNSYPNYGGRGIKVCERWREFANFLTDMGEIAAPLTLDRIDVDGNYCPENCRLATPKEQANNRRPLVTEGTPDILLAPQPLIHRPPVRHGLSQTKVYRTWISMRVRCYNPKSSIYRYYGGRGITVCERWHTFLNFLADMGEPCPGESLDRIDVNGDYCPENCRWASASQQSGNRRPRIPAPH